MPLMRSPDSLEHLDRPGLQAAVGRGLVLAERRRPVGHDREQPRPAAADPRPEAPMPRCRAWVCSHRSYGGMFQVASSWSSAVRRVHVVLLEGLRRSARAAPAGRRPSRRPACVASILLVASVARARCSALLTEATVVPSSSATSSAFQCRTSRRMSTARWRGRQVLERRDERQPDRLAGDRDIGGIAAGRARRGRRGPARSRCSRAAVRGACVSAVEAGPEVHRAGPALWRAEHVEADVGRDPVQPRAERRATLEPVEVPPRADHRLLDGVLGLEGRPEHPVAVAGELDPMGFEERLEPVRLACRGARGGALDGGVAHRPMVSGM